MILINGTSRIEYIIGSALGGPRVDAIEIDSIDIERLLRMRDEEIRDVLEILLMRFPPQKTQSQLDDIEQYKHNQEVHGELMRSLIVR